MCRAPVLCSRQSGSDGDAPTTHVVVNDFRHAGLSGYEHKRRGFVT